MPVESTSIGSTTSLSKKTAKLQTNPKLISRSGAILLAATDWGSLHNQISTTHTHSPNLEDITRLFTTPFVPFDSVCEQLSEQTLNRLAFLDA